LNELLRLWDGLEGFRAPLVTGLIALVAAAVLTPGAKALALKFGAVDDPTRDARRVHKEPIPKWGGLAIFAAIVIALAAVIPFAMPLTGFPSYLVAMLLVGAFVVVMGALDDLKDFSSKIQLAYLLAAGIMVQLFADRWGIVQIQGIVPPFGPKDAWVGFGWAAFPVTAIYIFVVSKTMDTIDGIDGLAGGIAAIAGFTLATIAFFQEQPRVALVSAAIAGASAGFLFHNSNPAKIFMGTGGAQVLGFLLACISIVGAFKTAATLAIIIPLLVFGVPLIDMVQVVTRRAMSGDPIMQADKRHLHHSLLKQGLTQKQAVFVLYAVASVLCGVLVVIVVSRG
jgi:UDP-GlcNAc:undecaprenyl-phosphate GlcNAc-1-phosphate transferase